MGASFNHGSPIVRSIYSIKDTMEQLNFITTKITENFNQQYDCAMNNTLTIPYFLACEKICRTYLNKLKRKIHGKRTDNFIVKFIVLNEERIASILHKSALSKFLSVKRDFFNFSTRISVGRTFFNFWYKI